jgi:hypothetical protein
MGLHQDGCFSVSRSAWKKQGFEFAGQARWTQCSLPYYQVDSMRDKIGEHLHTLAGFSWGDIL